MWKFLNKLNLGYLLNLLKNIFATKAAIKNLNNATKAYMTEVDYSQIAFDTNFIVGEAGAPYVGQATVGNTYVA